MKTHFFAVVLFLVSTVIAHADEAFYTVVSVGYSQNELENIELDSASYKFALGYELSSSWYLEAGFQSLGEDNAGKVPDLNGEPNTEYSALFLSFLGKAQGKYGELFYRLGALSIDTTLESIPTSDACNAPLVNTARPLGDLCAFDETILAGQIGLGFDFYIHHSTIFRTEIEWVKGEQGYSAAAIYTGIRLNF